MWVSALAGLVYTGYGVYQSKHPAEQQAPDPKKKTLVVLGEWTCVAMRESGVGLLMVYRHRMGLGLTPQST